MCYAKQYAHVLTNSKIRGGEREEDQGQHQDLLQLSPQKRLNVMKSLTALSKYLGCYDQWKNTLKRYNLKWTTGNEAPVSMQRFFNSNLESMIQTVKEMMRVLPEPMVEVIRYAVLAGLRPTESCESVRLLNDNTTDAAAAAGIMCPQWGYYNPDTQTLHHYLYPEIFLRATKKAYISYLSVDNYQRITNLGSKTLLGEPFV